MPLSGGLGKFFQSGFVKKCCSLKSATLTCRINKLLVIKAEYRGDKQKDVCACERRKDANKSPVKRPLIIFPVTSLHRILYYTCIYHIYLQKPIHVSYHIFKNFTLTSCGPPHSRAIFVVLSSQNFETFIFGGGS